MRSKRLRVMPPNCRRSPHGPSGGRDRPALGRIAFTDRCHLHPLADEMLHAERELFVENVWREIGLPDSVDRLAFHKNESAALQKEQHQHDRSFAGLCVCA